MERGIKYFDWNKYEDAILEFNKAKYLQIIDGSNSYDNLKLLAQTHYNLAITHAKLNNFTKAYEEAQRESLVEKLGKARGGVSTGGFAGSGARQSGLSGAERLYRGGYEDILGDIMKMRAGATEDVMDTIYGWQELMSTQ